MCNEAVVLPKQEKGETLAPFCVVLPEQITWPGCLVWIPSTSKDIIWNSACQRPVASQACNSTR